MSGFVCGDRFLLFRSDDARTLLKAAYDAVDGSHEVLKIYGVLIVAGCDKCCLVAYVSDVGT